MNKLECFTICILNYLDESISWVLPSKLDLKITFELTTISGFPLLFNFQDTS